MSEDLGDLALVPLGEMEADPKDAVIDLREWLEDKDLILPHIKAEGLVDQTFIVYGVKPFESAYDDSDYAYFCKCTDEKRKEQWTTVLGGQAVKEMLNAYIEHGGGNPFKITLRHTTGGKHGGYYVIE